MIQCNACPVCYIPTTVDRGTFGQNFEIINSENEKKTKASNSSQISSFPPTLHDKIRTLTTPVETRQKSVQLQHEIRFTHDINKYKTRKHLHQRE